MEAISPTPTEPRDDSPDSPKVLIIKQIESIDREIEKFEASVKMMEKKAEELEEAASIQKTEGEVEGGFAATEEEDAKNKNQSLPQMIYAANKVRYRLLCCSHQGLVVLSASTDAIMRVQTMYVGNAGFKG